jgi:hypothetical protein
MFRHMRPSRSASFQSVRDDLAAILHHLHRQDEKMSELSDGIATLQTDITTLGTAISDLSARVGAGGTPDPDVAAAVAALAQSHTDLTNDAASLAAIAPAPAA